MTEHSTYVIDAESAAEMARLSLQARLTTEAMNGAYPDDISSSPHAILDIACGPGEWLLNLASRYPQAEVIGVDISRRMIEYAQAQAKMRNLTNATFRVMDVTQPLDFTDGLFDFINARFLFGFMNPVIWPKLVSECFRITKPGGTMRLTEGETPISNSRAVEAMYGYFLQSLQRSGRSALPDGRQIATTPLLRKFLHEAGWEGIQTKAHILDYSSGTEPHDAWIENEEKSFELMAPFYIRESGLTQDHFDSLYQQLQHDHQSESYYALFYFLSAWGQKPSSAKSARGKRV